MLKVAFSHVAKEQELLDKLRVAVAVRGTGITDLYVLAAVAADRDLDPEPRAAFISTNSRDFAVRGSSSKLPRDFYAVRKLVYLDKFKLASAERLWNAEEMRGWPTPAAPQSDPQLQEAQGLLYALPPEKRADAVTALKSLASKS